MNSTIQEDDRISFRQLWGMALATLAVRLLFVLVTARQGHLDLPGYAAYGDGHSYLDYARLFYGDRRTLEEGDVRLFPGFPALIALAHLSGIPYWAAALGITWLCAAACSPMAALLFRSRAVGWAMVFWIPDYVLITSVISTEAPMLAASLLALLLALREKGTGSAIFAGILFGIAGVVRPMACFAAIAFGIHGIANGRWRRVIVIGTIAMGLVLLGLLGMQKFWGDALIGARSYANDAYHGQLFTWPFGSILMTPLREHVPMGKTAYVWAHVLVSLAACEILAMRWISKSRRPLDGLAFLWLAGVVIFNLCVGDKWGFECYARFLVPALPTLFEGLRPILPKKFTWASAFGIVSFGLAVVSFMRRH